MYLYTDHVRHQLTLALELQPVDPRVAEYLRGPFMTSLRKMEDIHVRLVLGHESLRLPESAVQCVTWAEASESLRQALMNGEALKAIAPLAFRKLAQTTTKQLVRYVTRGSGRDCESIRDHDMQGIKREYDRSYAKAWKLRRDREAPRQMHTFFTEGDTELVLLTGNASLGVVGTALRNCMRHAYTGEDKRPFCGPNKGRHELQVYVGFRNIKTKKWTSLGRLSYDPHDWSTKKVEDLEFMHSCHEALENEDSNMPEEDGRLWNRLVNGEFRTELVSTWKRDRVERQSRQTQLKVKVLGEPEIVDWYARIKARSGLGSRRNEFPIIHPPTRRSTTVTGRMVSPMPTLHDLPRDSTIRFLPQEHSAEDIYARFYAAYPDSLRHRRLTADRLGAPAETFSRMYGGVNIFDELDPLGSWPVRAGQSFSRALRFQGDQEQMQPISIATSSHLVGLHRWLYTTIRRRAETTMVVTDSSVGWSEPASIQENESQRTVREHNVANPAARRTKNQLEVRAAQRRTKPRAVNGLLARLTQAVAPQTTNSMFNI